MLLAVFLVQLGLGVAMGFFARKALKSAIAIGACLLAGGLLDVWNPTQLKTLNELLELTPDRLMNLLNVLTELYAVMGVVSISFGFLVGFVLGGKG